MQQLRTQWITPEEYLESERQAETKSEYFAGEVFAMAGANRAHNLIVLNIVRGLRPHQANKACETYANDMRVEVSPTGLYTYPDLVVVCGSPQFKDSHEDTLLNPTVIVEVLSKSTASYDQGQKFEHYRTLASLTDYLLVSQDRAAIEHRARQPGSEWQLEGYHGLDAVVSLPSIGCELRLAEVYAMIQFSDADAARGWLRIVKETPEDYQLERPGSPAY